MLLKVPYIFLDIELHKNAESTEKNETDKRKYAKNAPFTPFCSPFRAKADDAPFTPFLALFAKNVIH